jgi:hypothetical protein
MKLTATSLLALAASAGTATAHMDMANPPPFRSKHNPNVGPDKVDSDMTANLDKSGSNFPCKGYQVDMGTPLGKSVVTYTQGGAGNVTIEGGAAHNGGSCQISLSYDNAKTFTVIQSIVGNCPVTGGSTFNFKIPGDAPTGAAILSWSWFNKVGNREMYQNCASVTIDGGSGAADSVKFSERPAMMVANVGNGCSTLEGSDPEFANPGPDVLKQSDKTSPFQGTCAGAAPGAGGSGGGSGGGAGPGNGSGSGSGSGNGNGNGGGNSGGGSGASTPASAPASAPATSAAPASSAPAASNGASGGTKPTEYVPSILSSARSSSSPAPSSSPAASSSAGGSQASSSARASSSGRAPATTSTTVVSPGTTTVAADSDSSSLRASAPMSVIPVTDEPSSSSLPGGVFVTTGGATASATGTGAAAQPTTMQTVTKPMGTGTGATKTTAAAPAGTGSGSVGGGAAGQQTGACANEGAWNCIGGTSFQRCASGAWSAVIPMAAGTSCSPGVSDSLHMGGAAKERRGRRFGGARRN